ncbi:MAG: hypothetical protein AABX48_01900 [Nanoarchaeota archaeon]
MKTENFVKTISEIKEKNELDLSTGEDLSIALMNIVSLEEHSFFSFVKTHDEKFLEILETCRELRKRLLAKIVKKDDDSEKWCMSKHLLASSMRMYEVGNRFLHEKKIEEAKQSYNDAAELYALFWKLNLENKSKADLSKNSINYNTQEKKSIFSGIKKLLECCKE